MHLAIKHTINWHRFVDFNIDTKYRYQTSNNRWSISGQSSASLPIYAVYRSCTRKYLGLFLYRTAQHRQYTAISLTQIYIQHTYTCFHTEKSTGGELQGRHAPQFSFITRVNICLVFSPTNTNNLCWQTNASVVVPYLCVVRNPEFVSLLARR